MSTEELCAEALGRLHDQDSLAVIEYLNGQTDGLMVTKSYSELVKHLYWQDRNIVAVILMARAGMQFGITCSSEGVMADAERALKVRGTVKEIAYNLASFTWPGWKESGIEITTTDLSFGLDAARINLRFAQELNKGNLPLSRAFWMLGAQAIAAKDYALAKTNFEQAVKYADLAYAAEEQSLAEGFAVMALSLASGDPSLYLRDIVSRKVNLTGMENGLAFIDQIETAWNVFATD